MRLADPVDSDESLPFPVQEIVQVLRTFTTTYHVKKPQYIVLENVLTPATLIITLPNWYISNLNEYYIRHWAGLRPISDWREVVILVVYYLLA
jgi:hypothetical protein